MMNNHCKKIVLRASYSRGCASTYRNQDKIHLGNLHITPSDKEGGIVKKPENPNSSFDWFGMNLLYNSNMIECSHYLIIYNIIMFIYPEKTHNY